MKWLIEFLEKKIDDFCRLISATALKPAHARSGEWLSRHSVRLVNELL